MHDISHFLLPDRTTNVMVMERRLIRKSLSKVEEKWYSVLFNYVFGYTICLLTIIASKEHLGNNRFSQLFFK